MFLIVSAVACDYTPPGNAPDQPIDAPEDPDAPDAAPEPMSDARACFGTFTTICLTAPPTEPRTLTTAIDTDSTDPAICAPTIGELPLCVTAGTEVTINTVR